MRKIGLWMILLALALSAVGSGSPPRQMAGPSFWCPEVPCPWPTSWPG